MTAGSLSDYASGDGTMFLAEDYEDLEGWRSLLAEQTHQRPDDIPMGLVSEVVADLRADAVRRLGEAIEQTAEELGVGYLLSWGREATGLDVVGFVFAPFLAFLPPPTGLDVVSACKPDRLNQPSPGPELASARIAPDGDLRLGFRRPDCPPGEVSVRAMTRECAEELDLSDGATLVGKPALAALILSSSLGLFDDASRTNSTDEELDVALSEEELGNVSPEMSQGR